MAANSAALDLTLRRLGTAGGGIDAEMRHVIERCRTARALPGGTVEHEQALIRRRPDTPSRFRREERPGAVLPGRDRIILPGPVAGRPACDDVPLTVRRARRRRGERQIENADLNRRVEYAQRLVMGDVLLGLAAVDIRQPEIRCVCHGVSEGESEFSGMTGADGRGDLRDAKMQTCLRRAEIRQLVRIGIKRFRNAACDAAHDRAA